MLICNGLMYLDGAERLIGPLLWSEFEECFVGPSYNEREYYKYDKEGRYIDDVPMACDHLVKVYKPNGVYRGLNVNNKFDRYMLLWIRLGYPYMYRLSNDRDGVWMHGTNREPSLSSDYMYKVE